MSQPLRRCRRQGPFRRAETDASLPVGQGRFPAKPDCPQNPGAEPLLSQQALPALKHEQNSNDRFRQDQVILLRLDQGQLQDLVPPQKQLCLFLHRPEGRPRRKIKLQVGFFLYSHLTDSPHLSCKSKGYLVLLKLRLPGNSYLLII